MLVTRCSLSVDLKLHLVFYFEVVKSQEMQCVQLSLAFTVIFYICLSADQFLNMSGSRFIPSLGVTGQDGDVRWSQAAHLQLHSGEINSFHLINIIRFSVMSEFESDVLTELPGST